MKTMKPTQQNAQALLRGTGLSLLDAARLIRQIMDFKPQNCAQNAAAYCTRIIQVAVNQQHIKRITTPQQSICPPNWRQKWQQIRKKAGFTTHWVQDILRHTYATYHAKRYKNMPLLQLNMGHRDQSLLRARYVNMQGISKADAEWFFNIANGIIRGLKSSYHFPTTTRFDALC